MDACTIVEFRRALQQPESLFCTLHNVVVEIATLSRTKHFAECRATLDGKSAMIYAPITPQAMDYALRASLALAHTTGSRCITPMEIYGAEMRCGINLDKRCSLIVEYPLHGIPLRKAAYTTSPYRSSAFQFRIASLPSAKERDGRDTVMPTISLLTILVNGTPCANTSAQKMWVVTLRQNSNY